MERRVGKDFVWLIWQVHREEVLLDDADVVDMILLEIATELVGGGVVRLDSPNFTAPLRQSKSNYSGAGTDVEDEVALLHIAVADEHES